MNTEILETLQLKKGNHSSADDGMCAMEAAAYIAGEMFSDHPQCVDPAIAAYMRRLNDRLNDKDRQALKPYVLKVIGTRSTKAVQIKRAYLAIDWSVRVFTPTWLELTGMSDEAKALRELGEVTCETSEKAREVVRGIREKTWAKRSQTRVKMKEKYAAYAYAYAYAYTAYAYAYADDAVAADAAYAYADAAADAVAAASYSYSTAYADAVATDAADAADAAEEKTYKKVYDEVYARCEKALEPTAKRMLPLALELLDKMIAVRA